MCLKRVHELAWLNKYKNMHGAKVKIGTAFTKPRGCALLK
jgi:hypothetical protein